MGISKIKWCGEYKGVHIFRDYSVVDGEQVYLGTGQGCHTFWFRNVEEAKKFIDKYRDKINPHMPGLGLIPSNLCKKCRWHYPFGTKEWKGLPPDVCKKLKEELKKAVGGL